MTNRIEQIWQEYHTKLYNFIQSRVGAPHVADDILQEVFIRIYSRIDTLREDSKLQSWIYQITRNAIIDHYRSDKTMASLPEILVAPEIDSSEETRQEIASRLVPMIQDVPEHYRQALMLSEIEGLKQKEVAARQGLSLSGAKSRIQRGRAMLKEMLLECCRFEFDHRGRVTDYEGRA